MKKNILLIGCLVVIASCGRYSKVVDLPKKDQMQENSRIYGEVDGPARQSKNTYPTPADAADQSARIKEILFNGNKPVSAPVAQEEDHPFGVRVVFDLAQPIPTDDRVDLLANVRVLGRAVPVYRKRLRPLLPACHNGMIYNIGYALWFPGTFYLFCCRNGLKGILIYICMDKIPKDVREFMTKPEEGR